jgi:hypothetical protein
MDFLIEEFRWEYILLIPIALALGWFVIRFLFHTTAKFLRCGCLLVLVAVVGWALYTYVL